MDWEPVNIVGGDYSDDALPWTAQATVNYLIVPAEREGTMSPAKLRGAPGLVRFAESQAKPVRGAYNAEGLFLIVVGRTLYRVNKNGTTTAIGTIPGVGRVSIAHNKHGAGNEIAIANGQSGYVYDTTVGALSQITDEGFPGSPVFEFVAGYMAGVDPFGRFWFISELGQARQYNTLDRNDAESEPDKILTLIRVGEEILVFGERTGEFFRNTGQATGTWQRVNGVSMSIGCASRFSLARLDNSIFWLGNDGKFYRLEGNTPVRISTAAQEKSISGLDWSKVFCTTFEDQGHAVVYFTFPDGYTWGYDALSRDWHRRESHGLKRWRVNTLTKWAGAWYAGDFSNGRLYRLDWDELHEDGQPLVSRRRGGVTYAGGNVIGFGAVRLEFDVGRIPVGVTDHFCSLRYSDDGGHNWSKSRVLSLGRTGQFRRKVIARRLGRSAHRIWEVEVSSPGRRDLLAAAWNTEATAA